MQAVQDRFQQGSLENNQGVDALERGDTGIAMERFRAALRNLMAAVNMIQPPPSAEHCMEPSTATPIRQSRMALPGLVETKHHTYIFQKALNLIDDLSMFEKECHKPVVEFSCSVVLANFALAFHLQGQHTGCEASLAHASELYGKSLEVLSRTCGGQDRSTLALLIFNNRALIHYEQCEYEKWSICMKSAAQLMGHVDNGAMMLSRAELEGLTINMILQDTPKVAHAA